jgi:hypothetical protein
MQVIIKNLENLKQINNDLTVKITQKRLVQDEFLNNFIEKVSFIEND